MFKLYNSSIIIYIVHNLINIGNAIIILSDLVFVLIQMVIKNPNVLGLLLFWTFLWTSFLLGKLLIPGYLESYVFLKKEILSK